MSKSTPRQNSLQIIAPLLQQLAQQLSKIHLMALFITNWQLFREVFNHSTSALISLKTNEDIETVTEYLNTSIINAIRSSTPTKSSVNKYEYPHHIFKKLTEKSRLRRVWQSHRTPGDKCKLKNATRNLTNIIKNYKHDCFQKYLANLFPTVDSNYSL